MTRIFPFAIAAVTSLTLLTACGNTDGEDESAEEFAARVNGEAPAAIPAGTAASGDAPDPMPAAPAIVSANPQAGPYEEGTMTDPKASSCGATRGASYLGERYSGELEQSIAHIVPEGGTMRAVRPGDAVTQDLRENRLNIMLDGSDIVRDLRCG